MGVMIGWLVGGLCWGSFLAAVVSRLEKERGKVRWRNVLGLKDEWRVSRCDSCGKKLCWWENIPILSFFLLKGRCSSCHSPIPYWYLVAEGATGGGFLLTYFFWRQQSGNWWLLGGYFLLVLGLMFVFLFDWRTQIIPDEAVVILVLLGWLTGARDWLAAIASAAFLLFFHLVTRGRGMGLGDVKFSFFMGLFLGWPAVALAFYFAFLTGGLVSAIMLLRKKVRLKQQIAFGPFLVLGTLMSWWWGEEIILTIKQWLNL